MAHLPGSAKTHRRAVGVYEQRTSKLPAAEEQRPVRSKRQPLSGKSVGWSGAGKEREPAERAIPEELLGGEATVSEGGLNERRTTETGRIHQGRICGNDVHADPVREAVVERDGAG